MKEYLLKIRAPKNNVEIKKQLLITLGIIIVGFMLGILQKWLDETASNSLPVFIQQLDISNYFGRLAVWILSATVISVYSDTALRASINTFLFFISMLSGYYLYCNFILGFLPRTYMMIWVLIAIVSFFLAFICWYAKGNGIVAVVISGVILGVLFSQAFLIIQGFHITHLLEVLTWIVGVIILRRNLKEFAMEMGLSVIVAVFYQLVIPYWG